MFFDQRQQAVEARIQTILQRSAALRGQLVSDAVVLKSPLALADRVRYGWSWLAAHPQWLAAGVAVLALTRPRRAVWLAARGWTLWRLWRRLQPWRATLQPLLGPLLSPLVAHLRR